MAMGTGYLDRIPIMRKLAMLIAAVMAVAFGVTGVITGLYGYRADHQSMERHLQILASAIGDNCSAALVFEDETAAAEVLSALASDHSITGALLMNARSETIATFPGDGQVAALQSGARDDGGWFSVSLRVNRVISVDGKTVGFLTIWANNDAILARSITQAVTRITAFAVAILIVLFVFGRMQRVLFAPMFELQETLRRVVRSRNYSIRAARSAEDELNDVIMAVNDLLAQTEELSRAMHAGDTAAVTTAAPHAPADAAPSAATTR
ncbi:MAG TPA: CHASE sensor domain-containing protein [Candidatus Krumholzibacteria bacterium]